MPSDPASPALPMSSYAGEYMHPGYGNLSLSLVTLGEVTSRNPLGENSTDKSVLFGRTRFLGETFAFHHVNAEHWLVEVGGPLGEDGWDYENIYTKAKSEVGADGSVARMAVIVEPDVKGEKGWAWFDKVS